MNYTADTLAGLRTGLADLLDGRATPEEMRRCTRPAVDGPVLTGEADAIASTARVLRWARAVRETLDAVRR